MARLTDLRNTYWVFNEKISYGGLNLGGCIISGVFNTITDLSFTSMSFGTMLSFNTSDNSSRYVYNFINNFWTWQNSSGNNYGYNSREITILARFIKIIDLDENINDNLKDTFIQFMYNNATLLYVCDESTTSQFGNIAIEPFFQKTCWRFRRDLVFLPESVGLLPLTWNGDHPENRISIHGNFSVWSDTDKKLLTYSIFNFNCGTSDVGGGVLPFVGYIDFYKSNEIETYYDSNISGTLPDGQTTQYRSFSRAWRKNEGIYLEINSIQLDNSAWRIFVSFLLTNATFVGTTDDINKNINKDYYLIFPQSQNNAQ